MNWNKKNIAIALLLLVFGVAMVFFSIANINYGPIEVELISSRTSLSRSADSLLYESESPAEAKSDKYKGGVGDFFHTYYINTKEPFLWHHLGMISPYLRKTGEGGFSKKLKDMDGFYSQILEGGEGSFQRRDAEKKWNELVDVFINDHENSRLLKRRYAAKVNENLSFYNLEDGGFRIMPAGGINIGSDVVSVSVVARNIYVAEITEPDVVFNLAFVDVPEIIKTDDHELARQIESLMRTGELDIWLYGGVIKMFRSLKLGVDPIEKKRVMVFKTHKVELVNRATGGVLLSDGI